MKRILLKRISLFVFVMIVANVRAQVTYTQQTNQYDQTFNTTGSGGIYNNGGSEIGMWMNGDNSGNSFAGNVLWKNFRTGSDTSNAQRSLQVGDEFTIQVYTRGFYYGTIGVSLNSGSLPSSSWSNRTANRRISIQQDGGNFGSGGGRGSWYATGSGSTSFGVTPNSVAADYILKFKITAPNKCNVTVNGTTLYDVSLGGTADAPITHYSIYMSDDRSLAFNDSSGGRGDTFWKQTTQVQNTGTLDLGSSNSSFAISNVLTNGLNANSTSSVSINKLVKSGSGNLTLTGANTYTGNTEIDNGELWIGNGGDIASASNVYVGNGGQLTNVTKLFLSKSDGGINFSRNININPGNAGTRYIGGLNTSGTNTFSGNILRNSNQPLLIEEVTSTGNLVISGDINGSGTVTKVGNGTVTFSGNNSYTGSTTVSAGTLKVQKALYTATITTSGISIAFNSPPTAGTYAVLGGALSSTSTLLSQPTGMGVGQVASFSGSNSTLTVNDTPTVSLVSNDADNTFCLGANVAFTATASNIGGGTVVYNFKVNGSSVQNSASNTYTTTGLTNGQAVTVEITITGGMFLTTNTAISNSITNTVNPLPATPTISAGGPTTFCSGGNVVLTSSAGSSYIWSNGAATQSTTVSTSGSYTLQVTNAFGCQSASSTPTTVTVTPQPVWHLDADADGFYSGTGNETSSCTSPGAGYSTTALAGDCNDASNTIYPEATEICWNGILENCSATLSQGCAAVVVNMNPTYHNTTLVSLATAIPAVTYSYGGFTNLKYRFSITNVTTGQTSADIIQTSRFVTIPAALHAHAATFTIKVSAVINEEIVPFAGNTITVFSPAVQLITLSTASCGATLATLATTLTANPGLNATGYTFRIRVNDANPTPAYAFSQSATRFVGANSFTGSPLNYASSYKVSVQYTFNDPVSGLPVQSGYGAECTVNTPSIPLIGMASPTCNSTVTALNASISAGAAPYATGYRFRIRLFADNGPTPTYYYSLPNASRFSSLTAFQGITLAYSTAYSISAEYSITNNASTVWSGFGAECKVTTPFFPTTSLVASQCGLATPTSLTQQLNITPYPGFPHYRVLLEEVEGEDVVNFQEKEISYPYFKLSDFAIAQAGKNYNVSVAIKLNGVFGAYDTACDMFTAPLGKTITAVSFKATAYPNPFANNFNLDVKTASNSNVNVKVYDMVGRLIEQKDVRVSDMETTTIGNQYPSGVYNVVVSQEDSVQTVRVVKR